MKRISRKFPKFEVWVGLPNGLLGEELSMSNQYIGCRVTIKDFAIIGFIYDTTTKAMQTNPYKPETVCYKVRYLDKNGVIQQIDCKEQDLVFVVGRE